MGGGAILGQGLSGISIRAAWDGTPVKYNTRNPAQYVVEKLAEPMLAGEPVTTTVSPFYIPCEGTVGNSSRNQLIGPALVSGI